MKALAITSLLTAALVIPVVAAAPSTGLNVGEKVTPFHPTHVAGPLAGSTGCFPCTFQNRPQVQVWVNGTGTSDLAAIAKSLDKAMVDNASKEFKAMIVWVVPADKVGAAKDAAKNFGTTNGIKGLALSVLANNDSAVNAYKFNTTGEVKNTVFAYKNWTVQNKVINLKGDTAGLASLKTTIGKLVQ